MIGLDTNVVLRYLLDDDSTQSRIAVRLIDGQCTAENPGFVSVATALEIVWVLRSVFKKSPSGIASHIIELLLCDTLRFQNEREVFEAAEALRQGAAEFEDALISALNRWCGCRETFTFDRGAAKYHGFKLLA